jgi:ER degradation enhancer, mannosidase alpha-like 2
MDTGITGVAVLTVVWFVVASMILHLSNAEVAVEACRSDSPRVRREAQEAVRELFYHGYRNYKHHALQFDELRPLSCSGVDTFGGVHVTIIDAMDALAVLEDWEEFVWAVKHVERSVPSFDIHSNVSVFETTIRVLGGLLSTHGLLTDGADDAGFDREKHYPEYSDGLLRLAVDLADRLMPAFSTLTGIPFGSVSLHVGVWPGETTVASIAAAGGLLVEFGTLSAVTGDQKYYEAAFKAMDAIYRAQAWTGLVGNHIDTSNGAWVAHEAGVGALIDSYYEYMVKAYVLFGDERLVDMFWSSYVAIRKYVHLAPWYLSSEMLTGRIISATQCSLGAFWPGLQVLLGDINDAIMTTRALYAVWRRYGCLPEKVNVVTAAPVAGASNYPLRPELLESVFYLHWATNDSSWIDVGLGMMQSISNLTRSECGFARIRDVLTHEKEDFQDSFFLSETLKYLYVLFDERHWLRNGRFVFSTEAHPMLIRTASIAGVPLTAQGRARRSKLLESRERRPGGGSKFKCPRRSLTSSSSACGFGMPGTDHPFSGLGPPASHIAETSTAQTAQVPSAIANMVRGRNAAGPEFNVKEGDVMVVQNQVYQVVRTSSDGEVLVSELGLWESDRAKSHLFARRVREVHRRLVEETSLRENWQKRFMSPAVSFPQVLAAENIWRQLETCPAN